MRPFVKWPGGKRQLLHHLKSKLPSFNHYYEPFIGGGAFFWELAPVKATIGDINSELVNCYNVIKEQIDPLLDILRQFKNEETFYYKIRSLDIKELSPLARAARFIYLNKTCFNGLYRENKKGKFNAAFGKIDKPLIADEPNLRAISSYLQGDIKVVCGEYFETIKEVLPGDFVYFDPPYYPLNKTANFTRYNRKGFTEEDQIALFKLYNTLAIQGIFVMLSNSNTDFIKGLYKEFEIQELEAIRRINTDGDGRKKQKIEVLIRNF